MTFGGIDVAKNGERILGLILAGSTACVTRLDRVALVVCWSDEIGGIGPVMFSLHTAGKYYGHYILTPVDFVGQNAVNELGAQCESMATVDGHCAWNLTRSHYGA